MEAIEEIINIVELMNRFDEVLEKGMGKEVIEEIVLQSRIEFNVEFEEQDVLTFDSAIENDDLASTCCSIFIGLEYSQISYT